MTNDAVKETLELTDVLVYVNGAGDRGLMRDFTPADDGKISMIAALPGPATARTVASQLVQPFHARFVGMPADSKPHITDAFAPGREALAKPAACL